MKKLILLIGFLSFVFSEGITQKDIYPDYTNKIINYEFNIENLNNVKSPFYETPKFSSNTQTKTNNVQIKKRAKITLLSIFENTAYIKVEKYLGKQLVAVTKKWISLNDKIYDCKLFKLTDTDAVFKCNNKILYKTINQKIPMLRDR
jgi:hypothetical protein